MLIILGTVSIVLGVYLLSRAVQKKENIYKNKHALVLGGCSGLGLALAKDLSSRGAKVTVTSRKKNTLLSFEKTYRFSTLQVDITNERSVSSLPLEYDLIFCCPGLAIPCFARSITIEKLHNCMETNFYGVVRVFLHYLASVTAEKRKKMVFISSTLSLHSFIGYGAYSPSKASLRSFYESVYREVKLEGLDLYIYYCSTIMSPGLEREEKTKPKITKKIEEQSHNYSATPENRAKLLLDKLPKNKVIYSDLVTQLFSHSTNIHTLSDFFIWTISPVFWFLFEKKISKCFSSFYAPPNS